MRAVEEVRQVPAVVAEAGAGQPQLPVLGLEAARWASALALVLGPGQGGSRAWERAAQERALALEPVQVLAKVAAGLVVVRVQESEAVRGTRLAGELQKVGRVPVRLA